MRLLKLIILFVSVLLAGCEKEIQLNLPKPPVELVVEASVNDKFPSLNYVYITRTLDYFNLQLDAAGVSGADVFISEGTVNGSDTVYDPNRRFRMYEINVPGPLRDTLPDIPPGFYVNPLLFGQRNKVYRLEIFYEDKYITGVTTIPEPTPFTKSGYFFQGTVDDVPRARAMVEFFDPPEPSYYRIAYTVGKDSNLLGWGASERIRLLNDETLNNQLREFNNFQDFVTGDTVDIYMGRFGRREYNFWRSFLSARNSDSPFSTPAQVKSNIRGAIGSFTGYGMTYQRILIK